MSATSASLLDRLRADPKSAAWQKLVELYEPLIRVWLHRHEGWSQDSDDLVQEVMTVVVRKLPEFQHNGRPGAFRAWLRTITVNCLRDHWRSKKHRPTTTGDSDMQQLLAQLADPSSCMRCSAATLSRRPGKPSSERPWTVCPPPTWPPSWAFPATGASMPAAGRGGLSCRQRSCTPVWATTAFMRPTPAAA